MKIVKPGKPVEPARKEIHEHYDEEKCYCPYCDMEIEGTTFARPASETS